jgi:putative transposase
MLELKFNPSELKDYVKSIPKIKDQIFDLVRLDIKQVATDFVNGLMEAEFDLFIGRDKHQRQNMLSVTERNYRNGHYQRSFMVKGLGKLAIRVPRDRRGSYQTNVLNKYQRTETALKEDIAILYLMGTSTRSLGLISKRLLGQKISHAQVSTCASALCESVEKWRMRSIDEEIKYLYLDGTNFNMRVDGSVELVTVLVVIGVTVSGHKRVLALQAGDKESASSWRQLFKDLKARGLNKNQVKLGIMDGLPGLEKVFTEEFNQAKVQRCQVHVARNVLCKVPQKLKHEVADDIRSIFYAKSKEKADQFMKEFKLKWEKEIPSAVKCLDSSMESTLRYLDFPEDEWVALRTTNPIERLNKEFKRRTKSMEIVAGETSCYNLLAVISLRMEVFWQRHPITFQKALPWFKSREEFTQEI